MEGVAEEAGQRTVAEMEAALDHVRAAPAELGSLALVVRRPEVEEREVLAEAVLDPAEGLRGDSWGRRHNRLHPEGRPDPERQLTVMNVRFAALVAVDPERIPLAGDQLYVDLDISEANLPPGTRIAIGEEAVVELTEPPHTGCAKFVQRFGVDAQRFVNSPVGRSLRLRGANARVVCGGTIRPGDPVRKLPS
ncbi:MAG TPA: MOSC domain-containing protein [Candidatus Dormibacteraeota bacterium]|nr:MOSC domain-containing protein [Candidatus Dormibacteraeota bacterium]